MGTGIARLDLTMNAALGVAVMQCKKKIMCIVLLYCIARAVLSTRQQQGLFT
jgi:hypothetical protein